MRKPIQITIPTPCHEKWDKMTLADKGRFCASCRKNVIDFTKASDREIAEALHNNKSLCGRFSPSQLERDLVVPKEKSTAWTALAAGVLSFVTLGSYKATAQETVKTEQTEKKTDSISQNINQDKWIITGTVTDEVGPLPSVNIFIKNTKISTQTDIKGNYSIEVKKGDVLEFNYLGFEVENIIVKSHQSTINLTMVYNEEEILMGIFDYGYIKPQRSFFGRIFHSIGNLFR